MVLNFQCPHCKAQVPRDIKQRPRGTRYAVLFDCPRCGRTIHIEGVAMQTPPKVVKP